MLFKQRRKTIKNFNWNCHFIIEFFNLTAKAAGDESPLSWHSGIMKQRR